MWRALPQDSCSSTIQHGQGHPMRDDVQSPPFCTAPALEKAGHWGWRKASGSVWKSVDVPSPTLWHGKAAWGLKLLLLA